MTCIAKSTNRAENVCMEADHNNNGSELIPEWIQRQQAANALEKAKREAESAKQVMGSMALAARGPAFWERFVCELDRNARALPKIDCAGRVSHFPANNNTPDNHCQVQLSKPGLFPKVVCQDIFYRSGGDMLRFYVAVDGAGEAKQIAVNPDGSIGVMMDKFSNPVGPEDAACLTVQRLSIKVS
jgi:hypothetical protein